MANMRMNSKIFTGCLCLLLLVAMGCNQTLDKVEFVDWVRQNMNKEKTRGDYLFEVLHRPAEYEVLMRHGKSIGEESFREEKAKLDGMTYYELKIGVKGGKEDIMNYQSGNAQEKQQRIYYFSYDFQEDIYLEINGQKIPCALFHFERSYDLANTRKFMLGFSLGNDTTIETTTLVLNSQLLNTGPVKFKFDHTKQPVLAL